MDLTLDPGILDTGILESSESGNPFITFDARSQISVRLSQGENGPGSILSTCPES